MNYNDDFYGKPYRIGDWKFIVTHDNQNIKGFFGDYRFLSNFEICDCVYQGLEYTSSEAAYQSAKYKDKNERVAFQNITPFQSMKLGRAVTASNMVRDWDKIKISVMHQILVSKFTLNSDLKNKLLSTGDKFLCETNWWNDYFWGQDINGKGENNLGKILMQIRTDLKYENLM